MDGEGKRLPALDDAPAPEAAIVLAEEKKIEEPAAPGATAIDAMGRAIEDVCEAIRAALASPSINKFTEASRLCQIGHQLQRARAKSIEDFEKLAAEEVAAGGGAYGPNIIAVQNGYNMANNAIVGYGGNFQIAHGGGEGEMAPIAAPRRNARLPPHIARDAQGNIVDRNPGEIRRDAAGNVANEVRAANGEVVDIPPLPPVPAEGDFMNAIGGRDDQALRDPAVRRVMLAVEPAMQVQRMANAAQAAESESEELKNLVEVRDKLPKDKRAAIDARIDALVESVETRVLAAAQQKASKKVAAEMAAEGHKANGKAPVVHPDIPR
jgi:hypothetical protein